MEFLEERSLLTSAAYSVVQDWGTGLSATITLKSTATAPVPNWTLDFDYTGSITQIWDGVIRSHIGNHYSIAGASWNSTLGAGGTASFGFVSSPGGNATPANYALNGVPIGGGSTTSPPTITIGGASVLEGGAGTTTKLSFPVSLSAASASTVTVHYATADGTATAGEDYQSASGTLTFAPGQTTATVAVTVIGDTKVEPDETLSVVLSSPSNATLASGSAVGTIRNDDAAPTGGGAVTYSVTSDWGTGFNGSLVVKNTGTTAFKGWTLDFDLPATISSIWNASIVSHSGSHYRIQSVDWNANLVPGATASIGFTAAGSSATAASNFVLASLSGGGSSGGATNSPPVAVADTAFTTTGTAVKILVLVNDTDPNGDTLSLASVTQGTNGTVAKNADGTATYTPKAGFTGTDAFTYVVSDGKGGTAVGNVTVTVTSPSQSPTHVFNPYVDVTLYPMLDVATVARTQGIKDFTFAFVVASPTNKPSWGGYESYDVGSGSFDQAIRTQIAGVRSLGGDVTVSFGGAAGTELAQAITDVTALKAAYRSVVDAYGLTSVDFDIEGAAAADRASIDRRSQAIAGLQADLAAQGKTLNVWLTLPVLPTGLTADGLYVVQSAVKYGVKLGGVNVMAMDYGDSAAPSPAGQMAQYAIQAATSTFNQLKTIYGTSRTDAQLWGMIGVTPMIGVNDVSTEVFTEDDARELLAFAQQKGLGRLSMWSLNRDQPGSSSYASPTNSGISQSAYDFAKIFEPFTS